MSGLWVQSQFSQTCNAVSYTHLDVYKRQLIMTVNLVLLELDRVEQKKRIEKLESTIEELKRDKGE